VSGASFPLCKRGNFARFDSALTLTPLRELVTFPQREIFSLFYITFMEAAYRHYGVRR